MQEHSRYEQLCATAAVGQISPAELTELQAHLRECEFCKELQTDLVDINSVWLLQTEKLEPEVYDAIGTSAPDLPQLAECWSRILEACSEGNLRTASEN